MNDLRPQDFARISKGFSVGINAWVSHPFVPNAYSFEADGIDEPPSPEIKRMTEALGEKLEMKPDLTLFLLRPKRPELRKRMVSVPSKAKSNAFMYGRYNVTSRQLRNLAGDLDGIFSKYKGSQGGLPTVVDNGSSVTRMLSLCTLLGFKEIVLVGVDLNGSPYFWADHGATKKGLEVWCDYPRPHQPQHETLDTSRRPFSNLDFIVTLSRTLQSQFGVQVFAGSNKSALSRSLPVFSWDQPA